MADFEVTIAGAGPAGATAAIALSRHGRRVALVDKAHFPRPALCAGWINPGAIRLLTALGMNAKALDCMPIREVLFFNEDLSKQAKPAVRDEIGYLVDRAAFDHALVEYAASLGVSCFFGTALEDIRIGEREVAVTTGPKKRVLTSRLFVLATGRGVTWLEKLGFDRRGAGRPTWAALVQGRLPSPVSAAAVHLVLGLDRRESFCMAALRESRVSVMLHWRGDPTAARAVFVRTCHRLAEKQLLPIDLSGEAAQAPVLYQPSAFALELDTHVGKNMLILGDAGGFVSSSSAEGIYPAMWASTIAADVIHEALSKPVTQDALMEFESRWRQAMADYMRPPNTDLQFLLPLIFSNQTMADRMATAFFAGENL